MPQTEMNGGQNFSGGQNFVGGRNSNNGNTYNNQGAYNDHRSGQVWHEYGDKNTYYTTNKNRHYDNSTNYHGNYYGPASHFYGPVNNVGPAENVISGGFVNQGKMRDYNQGAIPRHGGGHPPRPPPARSTYDEYTAPPPPPRRGTVPYDSDFPATESAAPQYQDRRQQRPPRSDPEDYDTWGRYSPPELPPRGPQDYPQQPSRNPKRRAKGASSRPPQQPHLQQRRQGAEQWPGEHTYTQGMANLKEAGPSSWDVNGNEESDSSDQDGEDEDEDEETVTMGKRMGDPNRPDQAWIHRGPPQPAPDQFWPRGQQRRRAPPPFPRPEPACSNYEEDDDVLDLSSLSLGDVKKTKKERRNPRKN